MLHSAVRTVSALFASVALSESDITYCVVACDALVVPRVQGISRRKIVRIQNQERAAEAESTYLANLFTTGMEDWEVVDIFNEP